MRPYVVMALCFMAVSSPSQAGRRVALSSHLEAEAVSRASERAVRPLPAPGAPIRKPKDEVGWSNSGGNSLRNGFYPTLGPVFLDPLWSISDFALIGWQPLIDGNRIFVVRQSDWPGSPSDSPVVALDLDTGRELWRVDVPHRPGDSITALHGVRDGRVYVGRAGLDDTPSAPLYALDAATGATLWVSEEEITAGPYDGAVFTRRGDLVVGDAADVKRIRSTDGRTVWTHPRDCVGGHACGVAVVEDAVYATDFSSSGLHIVRLDAATGAERYRSEALPSYFRGPNAPMAGIDGTVYLAHSGSLRAFRDNGSSLTIRWVASVADTIITESAIGPDGSIYTLGPGPEVVRLDPDTGQVVDSYGDIPKDYILVGSRFAVDAVGTVFFSTGGTFYDARLFAFTPDLEPLWSVGTIYPNIGGPALGQDGTLVMSDIYRVLAFRPDPCDDGRCSVIRTGDGRCIPGSFCDVGTAWVGQSQAAWTSFEPRKLLGFEVCGADLVFRQDTTANPQYWPLEVGIYDVSTPFADLNVVRMPIDPAGERIAEDLHTGAVYATFALSPETAGEMIRVPLGPLAVQDLQDALDRGDGRFNIGLANTSFDAIGYFAAFGSSLDVTTCPVARKPK